MSNYGIVLNCWIQVLLKDGTMKGQKSKLVRRKYDEKFKLQALKMIENGQSVLSIAQHLGISEGLLHRRKTHKTQNSSALEKEILLLKAKLKQTETERDILKKPRSNSAVRPEADFRFIQSLSKSFAIFGFVLTFEGQQKCFL
jgi:transposase-like protein